METPHARTVPNRVAPSDDASAEQAQKALPDVSDAAVAEEPQPGEIPDELSADSQAVRRLFQDLTAKAVLATARVKRGDEEAALAVVVDADGYLLTKGSEILPPILPLEHPRRRREAFDEDGFEARAERREAPLTCTLSDGRVFPAVVVGLHDPTDLALLKIEAKGLTTIEWSPSAPQVGDWAASVGTSAEPLCVGVIGAPPRAVIGLSAVLGVSVVDDEGGVRIVGLAPRGGAGDVGVEVDDLLLSVDGKPIQTRDELTKILSEHLPGDEVTLILDRNGERLTLKPTLREPRTIEDPRPTVDGPVSQRRTNFPRVLQHDGVLAPSDCGGPLVTLDGKTAALNIARGSRVETFAVPADVVLAVLPDLRSGRLDPKTSLRRLREAQEALRQLEGDALLLRRRLRRLEAEAVEMLEALKTVSPPSVAAP